MPIPEDILVYGRTNILTAVAHQQPPQNPNPAWIPRNRAVTRTITFHFTHGWLYRGWRSVGNAWFGTTYNIDLDGTLYQCLEAQVRTNHVGGAPWFTGNAWRFVNQTSIGVELARFGKIRYYHHAKQYRISGYTPPIRFTTGAPANGICDYSTISPHNTGTRRFDLRKIPGGTSVQHIVRQYYYLKCDVFNDDRNPSRLNFPLDVLFSEEQYKTMVLWAKAMCEMHQIPKRFFVHPVSGEEYPWISTDDLVRRRQPQRIRNECRERVKAHQGIMGHLNVQRNRVDPGASIDYYRIKRGISDKWWYPVNLDNSERAINYLDTNRANDYMRMEEYGNLVDLDRYYQANESAQVGYFPIGRNRIWHGGIHIPTGNNARPIYAMANGIIVAARVTNGNFNMSVAPQNTPASRCFVLIKHDVHTLDRTGVRSNYWNGQRDLIDYGNNSTRVIYSLYMHLEPYLTQSTDTPNERLIQQRDGRYVIDYNNLPVWLNHYLIDNPTDAAVITGDIIFPNYRITLGDKIGYTGFYITGRRWLGIPNFGRTIHLEVFTTEDISTFRGSPWAEASNRIEDPNNDIVCDLGLLENWILDQGLPGINMADIRRSLPMLRNKAVKHKSEWSVQNRNELSYELMIWIRLRIGRILSNAQFQSDIRPLAFHTDMVTRANSLGISAAEIGPYFNTTKVWHLHPFTFLKWINERVERHEQIMAEQDKLRPNETSNISVENSYVVGWQNIPGGNQTQIPQRTGPNIRYPEVRYGGNSYEINVDVLADQQELVNAPQTQTRVHMRLLDFLDQVNDRPHGVTVTRSYVANPGANRHLNIHHMGNALLVMPSSGTTIAHWYNLVTVAQDAVDFLNEQYDDMNLMLRFRDRAADTNQNIETAGNEMMRRIREADNPGDSVLTAAPAIQQAILNDIRLQVFVEASLRRMRITFQRVEIIDSQRRFIGILSQFAGGELWNMTFKINNQIVHFIRNRRVRRGDIINLDRALASRDLDLRPNEQQFTILVQGTGENALITDQVQQVFRATSTPSWGIGQHQMLSTRGIFRLSFDITQR